MWGPWTGSLKHTKSAHLPNFLTNLYIFLPLFILMLLLNPVDARIPSESIVWDLIIWGILFLLYIAGVYVTYKHSIWRDENIPHLLGDDKGVESIQHDENSSHLLDEDNDAE